MRLTTAAPTRRRWPQRMLASVLLMLLTVSAVAQPEATTPAPAQSSAGAKAGALDVERLQGTVISADPLRVGTKVAPPFAMKSADGLWTGISIDLWRELARELDLQYEFIEQDLNGLITGVSVGQLDVAIAALTVTHTREAILDFSHPYYTTGLSIAVPQSRQNRLGLLFDALFSGAFLRVVAYLGSVLLLFGLLMWILERRRNSGQFAPRPLSGIGDGFWWAAVTMTTVGYGDKAPLTLGGRLLGLVWMFAGIILISTFTAAITTSLTVAELGSNIRGPQDLVRVRVGTVGDSTSEAYLQAQRINYQAYPSVDRALADAAAGKLEAVVYDTPLLKYLISQQPTEPLQVLDSEFDRQSYAIALPTNSPLREPLNRELLRFLQQPQWAEISYRYLGE